MYGHLYNKDRPVGFVWDDAQPDIIDELDENAPHRNVDLLFRELSKKDIADVVIAIPGTVYGGGSSSAWFSLDTMSCNTLQALTSAFSIFKRHSTQIPMMIRKALEAGGILFGWTAGAYASFQNGYTSYGEKDGSFSAINIEDHTRAIFMILVSDS